jgi:hypothetical protein
MSLRFHRHGAGGRETASATGLASPEDTGGAWPSPDTPLPVPDHACCCTARPVVKVIMPATRSRPHPVDLWLCGHHWRASRAAVCATGASVCRVDMPDAAAQADRGPAVVQS